MATYFVSGYMRSGTSMMMRALEAGGLTAAFNPVRDKMNDQYGDEYYKPNGPGFYELHRTQYQQLGFPRQFDGKLIKCLWGGISRIVAGDYKIVYMLREFEEIRQSHDAFFGNPPQMSAEQYQQNMENTIGILEQRRDVDLTVLNYRDVVDNPFYELMKLKNNGWKFNAADAAKVVDTNLCRFKLEELEVGI